MQGRLGQKGSPHLFDEEKISIKSSFFIFEVFVVKTGKLNLDSSCFSNCYLL